MSYKNVSFIWNFVPYFLYGLATSFHEAPFTKLWCPEKRWSGQNYWLTLLELRETKRENDTLGLYSSGTYNL